MRVLAVCLGNICRSPVAEAVLRAKAPGWVVDSAGTAGWNVGAPPYGPMQAAARARGYDLSDLRARQVSRADFGRFDLILAMDRGNFEDLEALRPTDGGAELRLFAEGHDIPDPYHTRDFAGCLAMIEAAAEALLAARR